MDNIIVSPAYKQEELQKWINDNNNLGYDLKRLSAPNNNGESVAVMYFNPDR